VELDGNPGDERDWETKLYPYLKSTFHHWFGAPMRISGVGVDSGGNHTDQVYNFCRIHAGEKFFALKGSSVEGKPIKSKATTLDVNHRGRVIKRGLRLWWVGTDTAKDLIFSRLALKVPGPGYIHFSQGLTSHYFQGLTSEVRQIARTSSGLKSRWHKVRDRNEPLDTFVYCLFVSHALNHPQFTDRQWDLLEQGLQPDLFEPAATFVAPMDSAAPVIDVQAVAVNPPDFAAQPEAPPAAAPALPAPATARQPAAPRAARVSQPKPRLAPAANPFAPADWISRGFE
jgi:phage terminase large subunit GpA-like protein